MTNYTVLLIATILIWITVIAGTWQHVFEMPKWFAKPPASFELIRKQSRTARMFWIPLSALFFIFVCIALVLNWRLPLVRAHIIGALVCYILTAALSGLYFVKEIVKFTRIPVGAPLTQKLRQRVRFWLRWTTVRDLLQLLAALFLTISCLHYPMV